MERVFRDKKAVAFFILPGLLVYLIFMFYPICRSIYFSFFEGVPGVSFEFVGLQNYKTMLSDKIFAESLKTTAAYMLVCTAFELILGLLVAFFLAYGLKRFHNIARTIVYMPVVIPAVGVAALFTKIYEVQPTYGLLNSLLVEIGLPNLVQPWIGQTSTALGALCAADIWRNFGYYTVIFYAGIIEVPKEQLEAARIDGASLIQAIRKVVLPHLRPVITMALVLCLNNNFRVYDMPYVLTSGGPGRATYMLSLYTYQKAFSDWKYGYASMLAVIMMLIILLVTQGISYLSNRDKPRGEVKR